MLKDASYQTNAAAEFHQILTYMHQYVLLLPPQHCTIPEQFCNQPLHHHLKCLDLRSPQHHQICQLSGNDCKILHQLSKELANLTNCLAPWTFSGGGKLLITCIILSPGCTPSPLISCPKYSNLPFKKEHSAKFNFRLASATNCTTLSN